MAENGKARLLAVVVFVGVHVSCLKLLA